MTLDAVAATFADDPQAAFQQLRELLNFPSKLASNEEWSRAFSLFHDIGHALGDESDLAGALTRGVDEPTNAQVLFDIGYELIEQGLHRIAAAVLTLAEERTPGNPVIVNELVCAFEQTMLNAEACRVLRGHPELTGQPTLSRYLLAFHSMMTGDVDTARELYPDLLTTDDENLAYMGAGLEGMVSRADATRPVSALDDADLRGWHFVLNGALLLHLSPHGLDEPMRGRYAWLQDSMAAIHEGILRLQVALDALESKPDRVFAVADRSSQILAHAVAESLGVPVVDWAHDSKGSDLPGLIAVYDLDELDGDILMSIADHRPGQILWAHASCWTHDPPFSPDIVTLLYQSNTAPWAERMGYDAETKQSTQEPASTDFVEELARQILATPVETEQLADIDEVRTLASAMNNTTGAALAGARRTEGRRRRQWLGSPVHSARFA